MHQVVLAPNINCQLPSESLGNVQIQYAEISKHQIILCNHNQTGVLTLLTFCRKCVFCEFRSQLSN